MAEVSLYCEETPGLKLGPGVSAPVGEMPTGDVIVFRDGFATFDSKDYPDWERWVHANGTPTIRILSGDEGQGAEGETFECPFDCGKGPFKSQFGLNSHLRSHAPK